MRAEETPSGRRGVEKQGGSPVARGSAARFENVDKPPSGCESPTPQRSAVLGRVHPRSHSGQPPPEPPEVIHHRCERMHDKGCRGVCVEIAPTSWWCIPHLPIQSESLASAEETGKRCRQVPIRCKRHQAIHRTARNQPRQLMGFPRNAACESSICPIRTREGFVIILTNSSRRCCLWASLVLPYRCHRP